MKATSQRGVCPAGRERGIVLLMLIVVLGLLASAWYISGISVTAVKVDNAETTQSALMQAKQALLAYAVARPYDAGMNGRIGKLPCPDYMAAGNEGEQDGNCGNAYANGIGLLPWRTLGIGVLKDGSGNCLYYAVSPAYKTGPVAALNPDSYGQMQQVDRNGVVIKGSTPGDRAVAVIIAPGGPLPGQARNIDPDTLCGGDYGNLAAYLDNNGSTDNAGLDTGVDNVLDRFVQAYPGSASMANAVNDHIITITHDELWAVLNTRITSADFRDEMRRLTEALSLCLAAYGNNNGKHLPMPAAMNLNGGEYRRNSDYLDGADFNNDYYGRLPYRVAEANTEMANGDDDILFNNAYCNNIDLPSTVATESIRFIDDAGSDGGVYYDLWQNWKDHFFYTVSAEYGPDSSASGCTPTKCIRLDPGSGIVEYYAGIVFFSGLKAAGQQRFSPPFDGALALDGVDDRDDLVNYLENGNELNQAAKSASGSALYYRATGTAASDDIQFCIKPDMSIESC